MWNERTRILIEDDGIKTLECAHVLLVGLGGVGGAVLENLARAGIGKITVVDHDDCAESNLNRQLLVTREFIGKPKTDAAVARIKQLGIPVKLDARNLFLHPNNIGNLLDELEPSFVCDCIDSITCKAILVIEAQKRDIPVISSMGAGGRLDVSTVDIRPLNNTENCGLAREMRKHLRRKNGSLDYPVVFSNETAINATAHQPIGGDENARPRATNGTISYMPNLFGLMMSGFVVKRLLDASISVDKKATPLPPSKNQKSAPPTLRAPRPAHLHSTDHTTPQK